MGACRYLDAVLTWGHRGVDQVVQDILQNPRQWILPFLTSLIVGGFGSYVGMRVGLAEANIRVDFLLRRVDHIDLELRTHTVIDGHPTMVERVKALREKIQDIGK